MREKLNTINTLLRNNVHLANWIALPISMIAIFMSSNALVNANNAESKAVEAYDIATQQNDYDKTIKNLQIELYIMKEPYKIKIELEQALKQYTNKVLPYILFYNFYIKINDKESALIMLKKCIDNAKPSTQSEYEKLVSLLYDNNLRVDLQKKYIEEAYLYRRLDYSNKAHIEDLYHKIIKK